MSCIKSLATPGTFLPWIAGSGATRSFCSVPEEVPSGRFRPDPFNPRFAFKSRSFFPIAPSNLRDVRRKKKGQKRGRGKGGKRGIKLRRFMHHRGLRRSRTHDGTGQPYYMKLPKWPEAMQRNKSRNLEQLNLSKLRYFIEKGRLDARFPITQRHLFESKCVTRIKNGVKLFNVNDYPFPYKVHLEVAGSDQSSIDALNRVGGSVTIVYMERVNLRAHVKPYKFDVLPRTARPTLKMVHYLEKMRAQGAIARYIQPLWLLEEERKVRSELRDQIAVNDLAQEQIEERERQDNPKQGTNAYHRSAM